MRLEVRSKRYGATEALRGVRLEVARDEVVALVGPSGCGKTTMLNIAAGLDRAFDGEVERAAGTLGYVFQDPRLLPWRTVRENVALALPRRERRSPRVDETLAAVEMAGMGERYPLQLSLGMARRVALARAFVVDPDLLLMDEAFVSLDEPTAQRLRALLASLLEKRPTAVLFVTHNLREALALADRLLVLSPGPGRVVAEVPVRIPRAGRGPEVVESLRADLLARPEPAFRVLA
ncbi:MAG TPA: ABC transporter ATP-binding protein [Azospirillum sp.]|nr:ABC transporter ATP-binding protein [Azospirillum sp.]